MYAEDSPKNIRYLTPDDLKILGIKKEELRELAVTNLKALPPKIEIHAGPLVSMIVAEVIMRQVCCCSIKCGLQGQSKWMEISS
jgi:hypothetical protein